MILDLRIYIKTIFYKHEGTFFIFVKKRPMYVRSYLSGLFLLSLFIVTSCSICHKTHKSSTGASGVASPQAIIYQTKADYNHLVPVILSSDKSQIQSYPDIRDIVSGGKFALPTVLHKGYLLDNRGIGENVAFLKLTYEEYAALPSTPKPEELMGMIIDKDPLKVMYACGPKGKFVNAEEELNRLIDSNDFSSFRKLK